MVQPAPSPARVVVRAEDGTIGTVDAADVSSAVDAGAEILTPEQIRAQQVEQEFGGLGGAAAAAGLGAVRGATLGLSDPLLAEAGGERVRRALAGYQEANPIASGVGEAVGTVAPIVASAGTGAVARGVAGAGALPRLAAGAGRAVERGALAALGEGTTVAGRMGRAVASKALGGAAEGAFYGAGHAVSEATLGDHELTAEQFLADAGAAALFGGALSGASEAPIAAAGEALRAGRGLLRAGASRLEQLGETGGTRLRQLLDTGRTEASAAADRAGAAVSGVAADVKRAASGVVDDATQAAQQAAREAPGFVQRADEFVSSKLPSREELQKLSDEQAWRATYARKKFTEEADKRAGGVANVGKVLKETGVIDVNAGAVDAFQGPQEILPRIEAARERVGQRIGEIAEKSAATVKIGDVLAEVEGVIAPLRKIAGRESTVASLEAYRDSLLDKLSAYSPKGKVLVGKRIPVQDLRAQRIGLQDIAYKEAKALDPALRVDALRDIRNGLDGVEVNALVAGGADKAEIATLKRHFQGLRIAEDATRDAISRMGANRSVGATDYLAFVAGGAGMTGATLALANKIGREKGSAALSVFLHDLAQTGSVAKSAARFGGDAVGRARGALEALQAAPATQGAIAALQAAKARVEQETRAGVEAFMSAAKAEASQVRDAASGVAARVAGAAGSAARSVGQAADRAGETAARVGRAIGTASRVARGARQAAYEDAYVQSRAYGHRRKDLEREALRVAELARRPEMLRADIARVVAPIANDAPNTSIAASAAAARLAAILQARAPKPIGPSSSLAPHLQRSYFRDEDIRRFARELDGARRPLSILDDLRTGHVSREKIAIVREAYPKLFEGMQTQIMAAVAGADAPPTADVAVRLGAMFDVPAHWSLEPDAVAALQKPFAGGQGEPDVAPGARDDGPARPLRGQAADKSATASQRIEEGDG